MVSPHPRASSALGTLLALASLFGPDAIAQERWTVALMSGSEATDDPGASAHRSPIASSDLRPGNASSLRLPTVTLAQATEPARTDTAPPPARSREFGARSSYWIPAFEILGFDFLLNRYNHHFSGSIDYNVTGSTIRSNFRGGWVTDNDPFSVNQFAHPYQGSMYHGFARSAGLDYWTSAGYSFAGSVAWEIAGERTRPSGNDQVASGIAGSFLGEALFRMASLLLEHGDGVPQFWRELIAGSISPPAGFNRLAFGDRFSPIFSSRGASYYSRLQVGWSGTTHDVQGASTEVKHDEVVADFSMQYGLPGKPGYEYTRPFDYFAFHATASTANLFENIQTRGMLVGRPFGAGDDIYRGIWGLFGSYDYVAPQTYRISTTALSLGSVAQWWLSESVALQGSALLGVGYAAVGTLHGSVDTDYNYGVAPQALLATRAVFGERAALDVTAREYFVHGVGGGGTDNIFRADASFTVRVLKQHAVALTSGTCGTGARRVRPRWEAAPRSTRPSGSSTATSARTASARWIGARPTLDATPGVANAANGRHA
jgi:hypothetical protein